MAAERSEGHDETKTHQPYNTTLPEALTPAFDRYLQTIRPLLMAAPLQPGTKPQPVGTVVWVNADGAPYGASGLQKLLERHTKDRFGHVINAHLFRDCVASTMANEAHSTFATLPICSAISRCR